MTARRSFLGERWPLFVAVGMCAGGRAPSNKHAHPVAPGSGEIIRSSLQA
jgi:hypothetical protein